MNALDAILPRKDWKLLVMSSAAAIALLAPTTPAQEILNQWFGDAPGQQFGGPIAWVGDVNADGYMDIGVAAPYDSTVNPYGGMLRIISGKDGAVLHSFYGDATYAQLGSYGLGHPIGDLDRDGYDDVLVNEQYGTGYFSPGRVFVFSGRDGSVLLTLTGNSTQHVSGPICGTGDVDGDGVPDFAATSPGVNYVTVFSGATGAVIRTLKAADPASTYFGHAILNPGDVDGDGVNDLIVVENSCYYPSEMHYYAFSGATGAKIWQTQENTYCGITSGRIRTALSPVVIGDINGDGIADWAMGDNWFSWLYSGGSARCFSGKDGSPLLQVTNPLGSSNRWGSSFGKAVAAAGDVNGDGVPDLAASDYWLYDDSGGDLFFYSGVDGKMLFHAHGGASATTFGLGLAGGVDTDGDGRLDLFAGDVWDSTNGSHAGAATQIHVEPIVLDALPRSWGAYGGQSRIDVNGGIPGNPLVIFLAGVNGTTLFTAVEFDTFDPSRRSEKYWNVPSGLSGITAQFVAFTLDANSRLQTSNYETMTFP